MQHPSYAALWAGLTTHLDNIRHHGLKGLAELLAFSLYFILGLVTLGACVLAGATMALLSKYRRWQANSAAAAAKTNAAENTAKSAAGNEANSKASNEAKSAPADSSNCQANTQTPVAVVIN